MKIWGMKSTHSSWVEEVTGCLMHPDSSRESLYEISCHVRDLNQHSMGVALLHAHEMDSVQAILDSKGFAKKT